MKKIFISLIIIFCLSILIGCSNTNQGITNQEVNGIYFNQDSNYVYSLELFTLNNENKFKGLFYDDGMVIEGEYTIEKNIINLHHNSSSSILYFEILKDNNLKYNGQNVVSFGVRSLSFDKDVIFSPDKNFEELDGLLFVYNKLNAENVSILTGFQSMISSYIFHSTNKSLISYVIEQIKNINFCEILTEDNVEESNKFGDSQISLSLSDGESIIVTCTKNNYYYLSYYNSTSKKTYSFKSDSKDEYLVLHLFFGMAPVTYYFDNPVVTEELDCDLSIFNQQFIVKKFIEEFSDLRKFYETGEKFSGSLRHYLGKYNGYYVAMVDGCGFEYDDVERIEVINEITFSYCDTNQIYVFGGSKCYTLQEAFNNNLISNQDLINIKKEYEASLKSGKVRFSSSISDEFIKYTYTGLFKKYDQFIEKDYELNENENLIIINSLYDLNWYKFYDNPYSNIINDYDYRICLRTETMINKDFKDFVLDSFENKVIPIMYDIYIKDNEYYVIMDYTIMFSTNSHILISKIEDQDDINKLKSIFIDENN